MAVFTREGAARIAAELGGDVDFTLAIADVESGGRSDLPDGRPQILFEALWFHNLTSGRYDSHPRISSPIWNRSLYVGGEGEYARLGEAASLDVEAALKSTSWGLFQIMGFNHTRCGFGDVRAFVDFIRGPDDNDMIAFTNFVQSDLALLQAYRRQDSLNFAGIYNGPGQPEYYASKIDLSLTRFRQGATQANDYSNIQKALGIVVSGTWDNTTLEAVKRFQKEHGLIVDGIVGPMTRKALGIT